MLLGIRWVAPLWLLLGVAWVERRVVAHFRKCTKTLLPSPNSCGASLTVDDVLWSIFYFSDLCGGHLCLGSFSRLCLANCENFLLLIVITIDKVSLGVKIMIIIVTLVIEKTMMIGTLVMKGGNCRNSFGNCGHSDTGNSLNFTMTILRLAQFRNILKFHCVKETARIVRRNDAMVLIILNIDVMLF